MIEADLVVGADGRFSTVARLTRARRYHVLPSERLSSWAYFRGVPPEPVARVFYYRRDDEFVVAAPADNGLFTAIVCPSVEHLDSYRADRENWHRRSVNGCPPLAELLAKAERVTTFRGLERFEGFFREATGPGWVLVGDSGHFKDPTPGQGISDALRQVEKLSEVILRGFGNPRERDAALHQWWRWRDADAIQHYWFAADIGKRGAISPVKLEILRGFAADDELRKDFLDIFLHRRYPRELFGLGKLVSATARLLSKPERRAGALAEASRLVREEIGRRAQGLRPRLIDTADLDDHNLDHQPSAA